MLSGTSGVGGVIEEAVERRVRGGAKTGETVPTDRRRIGGGTPTGRDSTVDFGTDDAKDGVVSTA